MSKKEKVAFVTLGTTLDKINLLSLYNKSQATFSIEEVETATESVAERIYSASYKYALGITTPAQN